MKNEKILKTALKRLFQQTLSRELTPAFHRIHKKYLINVNRIDYIYPKDSIVEIGSESLPIGYAYRKAFLKRMNLLK